MKTSLQYLCLLVLLSVYHPALSQVLSPLDEQHNHAIYTHIGFDQALIKVTLGYQIRVGRKNNYLNLDLGAVPKSNLFQDFQAGVGIQKAFLSTTHFSAPIRLQNSVSFTNNSLYRGVNLSSELAWLPQFYLQRHTIGTELTYKYGWATHVKHSAVYKQEAYPDAVGGWYKAPAATLRMGGFYAYRFTAWELGIRAGYQRNGKWDVYLPPLYGIITANVRL